MRSRSKRRNNNEEEMNELQEEQRTNDEGENVGYVKNLHYIK